MNLAANISPDQDLPTIDVETFSRLSGQVDTDTSLLATPTAPLTPSPALPTESSVDSEVPVGEDVIQSCVTPRKVQGVKAALDKEVKRHRCAVRLLPYFFDREELSQSNADGTHGKQCLNSNKLNSLKVLVQDQVYQNENKCQVSR